jgi:hypothetical protein
MSLGLLVLGQTGIPLQRNAFAFSIERDPTPIAVELRVVGGKQQEPGQDPRAEVLDEVAVAVLRVDFPMRGNRPEVHDASMRSRGFHGGHLRHVNHVRGQCRVSRQGQSTAAKRGFKDKSLS